MPRHNATFRFEADHLAGAQAFGRRIRSIAMESYELGDQWQSAAARLLRVKQLDSASNRFDANVRFDAETLEAAKRFGQRLRRVVRGHVRLSSEYAQRNTKLLKVTPVATNVAPADTTTD